MPREKYQTRLPADTAAEVDDYIDEHDVSQSEAIRRLVESGLEAQDEPDDDTTGEGRIHRAGMNRWVIPATLVLVLASLVLLVADLAVSLGVV